MQTPIFFGPVDTWNSIQQQLIMFCIFYDNIQKMEESPPNYIIEDDMELDRYLKNKQFEIDKQKRKMKAEESKRTTGSHNREVFK